MVNFIKHNHESMSEQEWLDIFANNLSAILKESGMTQRELATESGLSEAAVSNYINGRKLPGPKALINMAYALDCSLDDLMDFGDKLV
jgi:transcriptional regulator with XRE-family HTH domain